MEWWVVAGALAAFAMVVVYDFWRGASTRSEAWTKFRGERAKREADAERLSELTHRDQK